jgi:pimeloyl-ACP methyl ester carboxylesterase
MWTKFSLLFLFSVAWFVAAALADKPTPFRFMEARGPHAVGLKVVEQYDYSRTYRSKIDELGKPYTAERARPLQTLIWYPAEKSSAKPMTVGDYANLRATETNFDHANPDSVPSTQNSGMASTLADPLWAIRDAPVEAGHFPVIIYAPSFSNVSWENVDLCEYLASHGYLVLASPDMGASSRLMTADTQGVDAQARDISFLIGYAHSLPDADMSEIAVAGFSWGGISNLLAAARDNRIRALVALDGSMRYFPGLVKQADMHPDRMSIPLLFFTQGEITIEEQESRNNDPSLPPGPNALNAWTHGDLMTVHMLGLAHGEFGSVFQRDENFWVNFSLIQKNDYSREDGIAGYGWMARYTLNFLDAYLKNDAEAKAFLKKVPAENGAPQHFVVAKFRAGSGAPVSLDSFREELNHRGWDHAAEVYASIQKQDPDFKLTEQFINQWGYELMSGKHLPEAIGVFKLNVALSPDSANVYDSLAEAYMASGQKQLSIEFYKKAIEKDPSNDNAKEKLKELEGNEKPSQ